MWMPTLCQCDHLRSCLQERRSRRHALDPFEFRLLVEGQRWCLGFVRKLDVHNYLSAFGMK